MTEEKLKQYRSLVREIEELEKRIKKETDKSVDIVVGKVQASMPVHPYIATHVAVEMEEPGQAAAKSKIITLYRERQQEARMLKEEIERFISSIENSRIRLIMQYRFIDDMRLDSIGEILGYSKGRVSQIISQAIKKD